MKVSAAWARVTEGAVTAVASAILVGVLAWAAGYGRLTKTIERLEKTQDEQLVPAVKEIASVSAHVSEINDKRLPSMQVKAEASEKSLNNLDGTVSGMKRKLNDEVIPWINHVKREGPPINAAQLQPLYEEQKLQREEIARVQDVTEKRAESLQAQVINTKESDERQAAALQAEMGTVLDTLWKVGEPTLRSDLDREIKNAMRPIIAEWQEAVSEQSRSDAPKPAAHTFVTPRITLSTKPHVEATLKDGVITLSGFVPSERARESIIETAESFRPKPVRVDADKLTVRP